MKPLLGIIGGMGPQASIRFYNLIIEISINTYGIRKNADFPHLLINSIPVSDLVKSEAKKRETIGTVAKEAHRLARAGATALVMPCNTMHLFLKDIQKNITVPLFSMIEAVVEKVKKDGIKRVGLLGSKTTISSGLYTKMLAKEGISALIPKEIDQDRVASLIHKVIAGTASKKDENTLRKVLMTLKNVGAQAVILGCTELPILVSQKRVHGMRIYDSSRILAEKACEFLYV